MTISMAPIIQILIITFLVVLEKIHLSVAFSQNGSDNTVDTNRRNLVVTAPVALAGAVVYGKLVADAVEKLQRGDLVYPPDHERRVEDMITTAVVASLQAKMKKKQNMNSDGLDTSPFRILEVGVGPQLRLVRRGLYQDAISKCADLGVRQLEWTGIDIQPLPSLDSPMVQQAKKILNNEEKSSHNSPAVNVTMQLLRSSISNIGKKDENVNNQVLIEDGYFDCIISALTLCSVGDPDVAVRQINRLLRQDGGTFGYVEHVAVNDDEPYTLLKYQQIILDPLQQLVADNCHLHRSTTQTVASVFGVALPDYAATVTRDGGDPPILSSPSMARFIQNERFIVDKMWPVSCQTNGVIQKQIQ